MILLLITPSAHAQTADWPCQQRLAPRLEAGSYWSGPAAAPAPDWRQDATLFALVSDIVSRDTPDDEALAKLGAYADRVPSGDRARVYPALFASLVAQSNDERGVIIRRIEQLGRRQRALSNIVAQETAIIDRLPQPTAGPDQIRRADLSDQRDFNIRVFRQTQQTMRYACEAPVNFERRLGLFAAVLRTQRRK